MEITKANGEKEPFDKSKFIDSLKKAGFSEAQIGGALNKIEDSLYEGITTDEIYDRALEALKDIDEVQPIVKYSLKRAVLELGPTGFPFEQVVSRVYEEMGYKISTGTMLSGKCIDHEVDIIAYKDKELILIETKFHNDPKIKTDTRVALYVKARYDDLLNTTIEIDGKDREVTQALLITNSAFTNNSKRYVKCVGTFDMISWTYPKRNGLLKMIEDVQIHPITSIPYLSKAEKTELIEQGCVFCKDLIQNPQFLEKAKVTGSKRDQVLETAKLICSA
jgi:Holliday junction resolvase-like predicted endonuclease